MVLNDWQRGKLPFYVKPPDSEGYEATNEKGASMSDSCPLVDTKTAEPHVEQDFSQIPVTADYMGDDIRSVSPCKQSPVNDQSGDEDEDDDNDEEEKEEEMEKEAVTEEKSGDVPGDEDITVTAEEQKCDEENDLEESNDDDDDDNYDDIDDDSDVKTGSTKSPSSGKMKSKVTSVSSHVNKPVTSRSTKSGRSNSAKSSGKFQRSSEHALSGDKKKKKRKKSVQSSGMTELNDNSTVCRELITDFKTTVITAALLKDKKKNRSDKSVDLSDVAVEKRQKKKEKNRKRKSDLVEEVEEKLTGKQKRKLYEAGKVKKIGSQFYATANVKNRRNR